MRMSGHEKSNYAGLYARQAYQTKKDSLSQPATAVRNLRYETDATIERRFTNFAAKASPAFGKFCSIFGQHSHHRIKLKRNQRKYPTYTIR